MRIAVVHNLPSGGAKRHTFEQVRELARRGHELVEFAPATADLKFFSFAPYVREQRVFDHVVPPEPKRVPLLTPYISAIRGLETLRRTEHVNRRIADAINSEQFDVVLAKDCHISFKPYVLRYLTVPSVFQCHHALAHKVTAGHAGGRSMVQSLKDLYYLPANAVYQARFNNDEVRNVQAASRVLTSSRYTKQVLREQYGVNGHVVYPGIDTHAFVRQELPAGNHVLTVGAITYQKDQQFLVSALARIPTERRPPLLIIANSAEARAEKALREAARANNVVLRIEKIADDDRLAEAYSRARVFVFSPRQEALGMAPLEAMACGTPVVAVAEGGVHETVLDNVTGWAVERDEQIFAERVDELLCNDATWRRFGAAGSEYVRQNWNWERAVDRLEHHLHATVSSPSSML